MCTTALYCPFVDCIYAMALSIIVVCIGWICWYWYKFNVFVKWKLTALNEEETLRHNRNPEAKYNKPGHVWSSLEELEKYNETFFCFHIISYLSHCCPVIFIIINTIFYFSSSFHLYFNFIMYLSTIPFNSSSFCTVYPVL